MTAVESRPSVAQAPARLALFIRSLKGNGAERSMANLAAALSARGHAVDLVLVRASGPFLKQLPPDVRVIDLNVRTPFGAWTTAWRRPATFRALAPALLDPRAPVTLGAIPGLADYLRRERPAALLSALDYGNIAAVAAESLARSGARIVLSQRNHFSSDADAATDPRIRRAGPLIRAFYPRADAVVAVSRGVAEDIARVAGLPPERVRTIYNAVVGPGFEQAAAAPLDHPWFADGAPPVILGVGKLKPQKDFPTLLRAFARLRAETPARLVILGEGPDRAALESLARDLGIAADVGFPGFQDNPFRWMARANLFVLSSAFEGLPGVLVQAIACGCPVVATDCPSGPREILEDGRHGPLVPVGDVDAMAEAMARRLGEPRGSEALKRRGAFFSWDTAADAYLDVLLGPLAEAPGRA
ncbi:glycosyltransferase [Methylopila musalis]|uniref:Glycosyltransferase n=1 Tax=Methylopila musalis TaxID=1134781 RepID=A0ABW3Z8F4_9HYPH